MAKTLITYGDKVTGGIPKAVHEQQWWFDDANETKSAINLNATELYDRTDGNIPSQLIGVNVNWANLSETVNEVDLIWDAVNNDAFTGGQRGQTVLHNHSLIFKTTRKVDVSSTTRENYDIYETYWELRKKLTVTGGANVLLGFGNTQLDNTNGMMTRYDRTITKVRDGIVQEGGFSRDLGVTGATPIEDSVNAGAIAYTGKGLFAFRGNDGTANYTYIYIGVDEKIGTGSGVTTLASEFSILTPVTSNAPPENTQTIKLIGDNAVGLEAPLAIDFVGADVTQDPITEHAIITITNGGLNISGFGAKGDGIQLSDFNVTGSNLNSPTAVFAANDIGKVVSIADAGASGEHLVTTISAFVDVNNVTLSLAASTNVTTKLGSYGTDNMKPLQDAFDYAITNNVKLYTPEGVYLIGDTNPDDVSVKQVRLNFTAENQNFYLEGAGKGLTTFLELDGKTQRIGNFTTMFYCNFPASLDIGDIRFSNFTFDKNGRSLTIAPSPISAWEQSHALHFVKSSTAASTLKSLNTFDIEIKDKIGGGIAFNTMNNLVGGVSMSGITSIDYGGSGGAIEYGQRGDIEMHAISEKITIDNVDIGYMQFEPSGSYGSSVTTKRTMYISNSKIDILEPTEVTGTAEDIKYNKLFLNNVVSINFVGRGLSYKAVNCELTISQTINSVNGQISDSTIFLPYDDIGLSVGTLTMVNYANMPNKIKFNNCKFLIDSDDVAITPSGYAITHSSSLTSLDDNVVEIINCEFDKRFDASIDAQNNGTWIVRGSKLAGQTRAYLIGATSIYFSRVVLENNDYSQLSDGTLTYTLSNGNTNWTAVFKERVNQAKWQSGTTGSTGDTDIQIESFATMLIDDISNRANFKRKGETFEVTVAAASGYKHYQVTTSGSGLSAVVKGYGQLQA